MYIHCTTYMHQFSNQSNSRNIYITSCISLFPFLNIKTWSLASFFGCGQLRSEVWNRAASYSPNYFVKNLKYYLDLPTEKWWSNYKAQESTVDFLHSALFSNRAFDIHSFHSKIYIYIMLSYVCRECRRLNDFLKQINIR